MSPNKPEIVHLTSVHPPFDIRIFHKECMSLSRAGYRVILVAPHTGDENTQGVQIKALPFPRHRLLRLTQTIWRILQLAISLKAHLYHFHDPELIPVGLALYWLGKKVVYDIHEDVPKHLLLSRDDLPTWTRQPLSALIKKLENFAARRFAALVAATPSIGQRFQATNPHTIVVNNFPNLQAWPLPPNKNWTQRSASVAYIGGMSLERGLKTMVEAMAYLPDHLRIRLKLAGRLSPTDRHRVSNLPGWQYVDELGFIDRGKISNLLNHVSAGLVVLHPTPSYVVSYPVKMFEYMAAGIPVIASDFPLWRQIIETAGCGLLVNPLDPQAIAHAIEYLLTHPAEAEEMGRRGRQAVEKTYNWSREEEKLLQLYADLLNPA